MLTTLNEIRHADDLCLDSWAGTFPGDVHLEKCHQMRGNQEWIFDHDAGTIKHKGPCGVLQCPAVSCGVFTLFVV